MITAKAFATCCHSKAMLGWAWVDLAEHRVHGKLQIYTAGCSPSTKSQANLFDGTQGCHQPCRGSVGVCTEAVGES